MNMKSLVEKRNSLVEKINAMFGVAETEVRAFNEEENAEYDKLTAEIRSIDDTMDKMNKGFKQFDVPKEVEEKRSVEEIELRQFETLIRENRAGEMKPSENGAVIPTTIANRIIDTVKQIAPLYAMSTKFNVKGELQFPVSTGKITTGYQEEFTAITSSSVGFQTVKLSGFLVGALSKVSVSLINNSQFDIVSHVVNKVAESIAQFLEKEMLAGATKITGVTKTGADNVTSATYDATVTMEDLIKAQCTIPQVNQANCVWVVPQSAVATMRTMKDENGRFYLQNDLTNAFGYTFLGKPVIVSDQMAEDTFIYGDWSGYYVNVHENPSIKVLNEKYADEHAVGVIAWLEIDGKMVEPQKMVVLKKA